MRGFRKIGSSPKIIHALRFANGNKAFHLVCCKFIDSRTEGKPSGSLTCTVLRQPQCGHQACTARATRTLSTKRIPTLTYYVDSASTAGSCCGGGLGAVGANLDFARSFGPYHRKQTGTGINASATKPKSDPAQLMPIPLNICVANCRIFLEDV